MHSHLEGRPLRFPSLVFCILRFVYCIPYVVYFVSCISYFVLCILNFVFCVLYFVFLLSDPSPIIGNACQWLTDSLTHWLTHSCLVNLIDVTMACEDAYSKLVEVVVIVIEIWSRFMNCELWTCDMNLTLGSVVPLAMFLYLMFHVLYSVIILSNLK